MRIDSIRPRQDNVLVQLDIHTDATEDRFSSGAYGAAILLPKARSIESEDAIIATVIAAGPGHYADRFIDIEQGTAPVGSTRFIPLDSAIVPGARVLLSRAGLAGDRIFSDERHEYRMVRAQCIEAVLEGDE